MPNTGGMPNYGLKTRSLKTRLAEAVRFELTEDSHPRQFSRLLHSTALPRFQVHYFNRRHLGFISKEQKTFSAHLQRTAERVPARPIRMQIRQKDRWTAATAIAPEQ
jgi:hypothetical protein